MPAWRSCRTSPCSRRGAGGDSEHPDRRAPAHRRTFHQRWTGDSRGTRRRRLDSICSGTSRASPPRLRASRRPPEPQRARLPTASLSDDVAMRHFAAIPRLRKLRAQETRGDRRRLRGAEPVADSRGVLGTRVPELRQPRIRGAVADAGAAQPRHRLQERRRPARSSTLPLFPALRELTPIDVQDAGFRHVGNASGWNA